jgi:ubiquinone/menaquinone biosynthesis C-methylase UbiE
MTSIFNISDSGPDNYEKYSPFMLPFADALVERGHIQSAQAVLDVACGTGFVARRVAVKVGPSGRLAGLDTNAKMLATATRVNAEVNPAIEWHEASALEMPFSEGEFDAVLCQQGVQFFPDIEKGIGEMLRVLKPGGRLVFSFWPPRSQNAFYLAREKWTHEVMPAGSMPTPNTFPLRDEFEAIVRRFTFADLNVEDVTASVAMQPMRLELRDSVKVFPWGPTFLSLDEAVQNQACDGMAEDLREYEQAGGSFNVPFMSHVVAVTK